MTDENPVHKNEKAILSCILLAPTACLAECARFGIGSDAFVVPAHGKLFNVFGDVQKEGKPLDFITLAYALRDLGELEKVGGAPYLNELFVYLPTAANLAYYLEIAQETHLERKTEALATQLLFSIKNGGTAAIDALATAHSEILKLLTNQRTTRKTTKQAIREICEEIIKGQNDEARLFTGIKPLDAELNLFRSDYLVVPGPTSSGKSSLAVQIALTMAHHGRRVLIFALEMSTRQVIKRALASTSGYSAEAVRSLAMRNRDLSGINRTDDAASKAVAAFAEAAGTLGKLDFTVIDDVYTLESVLATTRGHAAEKSIDCVVVDYPALLQTTGNFERRQLALANAANALKRLGSEINGLVITPSQVNKEGGTREAADFEHAANAILAVTFKDGDDSERIVTITKQRDGARGQEIALRWHGPTTCFIPLETKP